MDVYEALYTTRAMRRVRPRRPPHEVAYKNQWGAPLGIEIPEPLWSPET